MSGGGVTPTGFVTQTTQEILADIEADQLTLVDATLDLSPDQPLGQINGIVADRCAELWALGAQLYQMLDPNSAEGVGLVNLCSLTGTLKQGATPTKVTATVNLNAGVTLLAGKKASVASHPETPFTLDADVTNSGGSPANFSSAWTCTIPGPTVVTAGTFTNIVTPVSGWNSITNSVDGTTGLVEDTDTVLRAKRTAELFNSGSDTVDAIRAKILDLTGVISCYVRRNDGDLALDPDGGGVMLGHSLEVIVYDGASPAVANNVIAQAIWDQKPAGIQAMGTSSGTAIDALGNNQTVHFSRPTAVNIYVTYALAVNADFIGDTAFKNAVVAYAVANQSLGSNAIASKYEGFPLFGIPNSGITDVTSFAIGLSVSPTFDTNVALTVRQIGVLDSSRIVVTP